MVATDAAAATRAMLISAVTTARNYLCTSDAQTPNTPCSTLSIVTTKVFHTFLPMSKSVDCTRALIEQGGLRRIIKRKATHPSSLF